MTGTTPPFDETEICDQAKLNTRILSLLLIAYAKERGQTPLDALRFLGRIVAPGWDEFSGKGALAATRTTALNFASLGAEIVHLGGDETRAETTVTGWPAEEDLAFCGVAREDCDALFASWETIAGRLGLRYSWRREGNRTTLTFSQD
jgi:hypothetical protein